MMVLDTHVLLWWATHAAELPPAIRRKIAGAATKGDVYVSAISYWEFAMLHAHGRLDVAYDFRTWLKDMMEISGLQIVPLDVLVLIDSVFLPDPLHRDPADRMIVATTRQLGATLVTKDRQLLQYPHVPSYWQ